MAKVENQEQITANINLIAAGTSINGDIETNGDIRVDGYIKGNLKSKGRIVIGASGNIEGDIVCQNGDFSGTIKGTALVTELLVMKSSSKITGDIKTAKISIENGAIFTGNCCMQANINE